MASLDFKFPPHWINTKISLQFRGEDVDENGGTKGAFGVLLYDLEGSIVLQGKDAQGNANEVLIPKDMIGPCAQILGDSALISADAGALNRLDARRRGPH